MSGSLSLMCYGFIIVNKLLGSVFTDTALCPGMSVPADDYESMKQNFNPAGVKTLCINKNYEKRN